MALLCGRSVWKVVATPAMKKQFTPLNVMTALYQMLHAMFPCDLV